MISGSNTQSKSLSESRTNTKNPGTSTVDIKVPTEPLAFLHPETGTVVLVPPEDSAALMLEHRNLGNVVAEYQSANRVVQLLDEYLVELRSGKVKGDAAYIKEQISSAEISRENALDWQEKAYASYYAVFQDIDPVSISAPQGQDKDAAKPKEAQSTLHGAGKRLVELVALSRKSPAEQAKQKAEEEAWKTEGAQFKKKLASCKSAKELVDIGKWPKVMPQKLIYVRSDKLKPQWPKLKDTGKTKFSEIRTKDANGNPRIDGKKLKSYVAEQVEKSSMDWLKKQLKAEYKDDLEFSKSNTLGEWAESWNQTHIFHKDAQSKDSVIPWESTVDASAQLMRYAYGAGLSPELSWKEKRLGIKAEGHAEFELAKAEANMTMYFPRKEGWIWEYTDKNGQPKPLFAVVCQLTMTACGVAGASIAAELSLQLAQGEVASSPPRLKGKPGPKGRKARRTNRVQLKKGQKVGVASVSAGANAFMGAKAEGAMTGSMLWRDPEDQNKEFSEIASIAAGGEGSLGIGAGCKFQIEYTEGIFRLSADADLCIGVGAGGQIQFAVGVGQMAYFFKCIAYKLAYANFENMEIFQKDNEAFEIFNKISILAYVQKKKIEDYFKKETQEIIRLFGVERASAEFQQQLVQVALHDPAALKYLLPEANGMVAYDLKSMDARVLASADSNQTSSQDIRQALLNVIKNAGSKSESRNIVQHMTADGSKGNLQENLQELASFFRADPRSASDAMLASLASDDFSNRHDQIALSGNFMAWYQALNNHLADEIPHGYPMVAATDPTYPVQYGKEHHPLFATSGWHAHYKDQV